MRRVYILTEGEEDVAFLQRILPQDLLESIEVINAGGKGGIPSLARSLVAVRNSPVAVVMDADSFNADAIEERQQSIEALIRAANGSIPVKVVTAVPEIEAWFFAVPQALERILGRKVSADWLSMGKRDPKGVLAQLAGESNKTWNTRQAVAELDTNDLQQIRTVAEVAELITFLKDLKLSVTVA